MVERNAEVAPDKRIEFRIGIHLGDVVEESDSDLMGDGVNIAAHLEGACEPGGVCLSSAALAPRTTDRAVAARAAHCRKLGWESVPRYPLHRYQQVEPAE